MNNYDKMILAQQERTRSGNAIEGRSDRNVQRPIDYSDMTYNDYMLNVLYRTDPSEAPVMSRDDFDRMRANASGAASVTHDATAERFTREERQEKKSKYSLTKKGKIILAVYVILMVLLASILIVSNTVTVVDREISVSEKIPAAYGSTDTPQTQYIRAMTIDEENNEEGDWFDKLCDSLNK